MVNRLIRGRCSSWRWSRSFFRPSRPCLSRRAASVSWSARASTKAPRREAASSLAFFFANFSFSSSGSRMPRMARPRAGHPSLPVGAQRRLLWPLSAGTDDGPLGANAGPRFSTKTCDLGEFCTTKHHASLSTKHHASWPIISTKHHAYVQVVRASSTEYKYRLRLPCWKITQNPEKSPDSLRNPGASTAAPSSASLRPCG